MTDKLDIRTLAWRANQACRVTPGFVRCGVESEEPPVLAYEFDCPARADEFKFNREVEGGGPRLIISPDHPATVLEFRWVADISVPQQAA